MIPLITHRTYFSGNVENSSSFAKKIQELIVKNPDYKSLTEEIKQSLKEEPNGTDLFLRLQDPPEVGLMQRSRACH